MPASSGPRRPRVPASRDDLVAMAKQMSKGDSFGFAIGTVAPGRYTWGFQNLLWQNGANVYTADLKRSALAEPAAIRSSSSGPASAGRSDSPPANASCRMPHRGQARHVDRGSWNSPG